jgi:hypothetical protein
MILACSVLLFLAFTFGMLFFSGTHLELREKRLSEDKHPGAHSFLR